MSSHPVTNAVQPTKATMAVAPGRQKHSHRLLQKHANRGGKSCPVCGRYNCKRKHTITMIV